jgi:hypothetical protein
VTQVCLSRAYFNSHPTLLLSLSSLSSLPFKHSAPCRHNRPLLSECPQALVQGQVLLPVKIPHHPRSVNFRRSPVVNRLLSRAHITGGPAPRRLPRLFIRDAILPSLRKLSLVKSAAQPPPYTTARARMVTRNPPSSDPQQSLLHKCLRSRPTPVVPHSANRMTPALGFSRLVPRFSNVCIGGDSTSFRDISKNRSRPD